MDLEEIVNPDHKKEGGDWFAVFNPKAKRAVDVSLTLTLAHESYDEPVFYRVAYQTLDQRPGTKYRLVLSKRTIISIPLGRCVTSCGGRCWRLPVLNVPTFDDHINRFPMCKDEIAYRPFSSASSAAFDSHKTENTLPLGATAAPRYMIPKLVPRLDVRPEYLDLGWERVRSLGHGLSGVVVGLMRWVEPGHVPVVVESRNKSVAYKECCVSTAGILRALLRLDEACKSPDRFLALQTAATKTGDLYIRSVCFSPDGKYLATGAEDKQIRIWDIAKKRIQKYFEGHTQEIYSLDFSRDGRLIVSGSGDKTARIWDMETGSCKVLQIIEPDVVDAGVTSVAISPDGRLVAAGSLDTIVRIWETHTGNLVERLRGHQDSVYSVAFTPDGRGLVSGSLDKSLKYWDLRGLLQNSRMATPLPQGGNIPSNSTNFPGGLGRKEGGEKGSVCTTSFLGHKDYVLSVAVSPDNQWIVSGSKDRGVQFWDPRSATQQLMLQGHKNSVISIDLSPAGGLLATGSGDWQARVCEELRPTPVDVGLELTQSSPLCTYPAPSIGPQDAVI
ncbi:transcriptional repressor rco-1 [Rhizoctonia solani AG-1 IA]|uniref:Transcriptional repressor rco-1 n=1 Tax=Thanatephorus cucumeris (strain AG1-IA) TaxID=983506 RepID=L8WYP6_THACA|nr:transcriptional repressor rco-1 [Rhizoctonia solani AG-1 IA]